MILKYTGKKVSAAMPAVDPGLSRVGWLEPWGPSIKRCPQNVSIGGTVTPEILAMPQSRTYNQSLFFVHFFHLLQKGDGGLPNYPFPRKNTPAC